MTSSSPGSNGEGSSSSSGQVHPDQRSAEDFDGHEAAEPSLEAALLADHPLGEAGQTAPCGRSIGFFRFSADRVIVPLSRESQSSPLDYPSQSSSLHSRTSRLGALALFLKLYRYRLQEAEDFAK